MTHAIKSAVGMMELLPANEQSLAVEAIRKIVVAWDPDYTKLTPSERKALEEAENGDYIDEDEIDWDSP